MPFSLEQIKAIRPVKLLLDKMVCTSISFSVVHVTALIRVFIFLIALSWCHNISLPMSPSFVVLVSLLHHFSFYHYIPCTVFSYTYQYLNFKITSFRPFFSFTMVSINYCRVFVSAWRPTCTFLPLFSSGTVVLF